MGGVAIVFVKFRGLLVRAVFVGCLALLVLEVSKGLCPERVAFVGDEIIDFLWEEAFVVDVLAHAQIDREGVWLWEAGEEYFKHDVV